MMYGNNSLNYRTSTLQKMRIHQKLLYLAVVVLLYLAVVVLLCLAVVVLQNYYKYVIIPSALISTVLLHHTIHLNVREVEAYKTHLTPPHIIEVLEVLVQSQEIEWSCILPVRCIDFARLLFFDEK